MNRLGHIRTTIGGYYVRKLVLNLDRTVLIGLVHTNLKLLNPADEFDPEDWLQVKWDIDRENKICICQNGRHAHNISLENIWFPPLPADEKPVKNFYTFSKDAWHCKLYKWIFGKEPHKVHPTMCPYFWIMVVVMITLPVLSLIKLTGSAGSEFMEACRTYKQRKRDRKIAEWIEKTLATWESLTDEQCWFLHKKDKKYDELKYRLDYDIRRAIEKKHDSHENILREERWQKKCAEEAIEKQLREKRIQEHVLKEIKISQRQEKRQETIEHLKASKTSKIIGIGIVIVSFAFILYGLSVTIFTVYHTTKRMVGNYITLSDILTFLKYVVYIVLSAAGSFILGKYVAIPFYKFVLTPIGKLISTIFSALGRFFIVKPILWIVKVVESINLKQYEIGNKFRKLFIFLFGWIVPIFRTIVSGFRYTIEIFQMGKDLIYNMYKKNCPRITWVDEESTNTLNNQ